MGIFNIFGKKEPKKVLTDEEIVAKVTERQFVILLQMHVKKLSGKSFTLEFPHTAENREALDNLSRYGLINIAWSDIVFAKPQDRSSIAWTAYITPKGSSLVEKIAPRFIKGYKAKKTVTK